MTTIPFGVSRLDDTIGGAPSGTVILLAGESGAGAREFLYTSAAMNALAHTNQRLFDLYYGDLPEEAAPPPEVHYLSFTTDEQFIAREMAYTMAEEVVEAAVPAIKFRDFSPEYFPHSPIPREWYIDDTATIADLSRRSGNEGVLPALGNYLNEHAAGNLVLIDSVSDLVGAVSDHLEWTDIAMLVKGLSKAAHRWGGLILLLSNTDVLTDTEFGHLMDASGGTLEFSWSSGGSQRARTMVIRGFRGVLSRIQEENIVRFETEIHEGGFDISDVRKIR